MNNALITCRTDDHSDVDRILRRGANHRGTADIDLFNGFFSRHARARDCLRKRIEIYNHEIDRLNSLLLHGGDMLRIVANPKQAAVYTWMKGLHASVHHFWKARYVRDVAHRDACFAQSLRGSTR